MSIPISSVDAQTSPPPQQNGLPNATPAGGAAEAVQELARRLEQVEQRNAKLAERNEALSQQLGAVTARYDELNRRLQRIEPVSGSRIPALPASVPDSQSQRSRPSRTILDPDLGPEPDPDGPGDSPRVAWPLDEPPRRFQVGDYDDELGAFVLVRPTDEQRVPFEFRFDLFTQARYSNFGKNKNSWVDSTGQRLPVRDFSSAEITRNFLVFSGFGIDPRLQFTSILFSSTALNDTVWVGWVNFQFSRAIDVRVGNWLVPGTREWYESFRYTMGADRLMATTFFRPNISPGVWVQGEPIDNVHYVMMVANSLNRFTQGVNRVGSSKAFGGTIRWEPLGAFGLGPSDIEDHRAPRLRIGTSGAISQEANQGFGEAGLNNPEDTIIRLSNGTPLFRPGALAPGVSLQSTNVNLWALDAALKYRGLGVSGEYFFRQLDRFKQYGGRLPFDSLFDHGAMLQAGYFMVPGKVETFARTSFVTGRFGGGNEFGGGVNWYPRGSREWRCTFEVLRINNSPAQNPLTGYRAGESGTLFQLQWLTDF